MLQNMLCLYSSEMIVQLQTSQSCFLNMLNIVLTFQEALWWIKILTLLQIFDKKSVRFRWLSSISLSFITLKQMIKVKLWIELSRIIWEHIFQKIKQCEQSYSLLHNSSIITVIIISLKWVWTDFYMSSIARFALMLWTTSSRKEYQLWKIMLKNFTNYVKSCVYS